MSAVRLAARDLRAGYGEIEILRGINLEVRQGEVVVLLGANGAGKTTTLLSLAGETNIFSGTVEMSEREVTGALDVRVRAGMAYLLDERGIFPHLTVDQNLRLGRGPTKRGYDLAPELVGLERRRAGLCSGGEQQILCLARAMAADPTVLLADEISLGLAPKITKRMLETIRRSADAGAATLIVEQHARQALEFADRGYVMKRGAIVMEGTAKELLSRIDEIERAYLHTDIEPGEEA